MQTSYNLDLSLLNPKELTFKEWKMLSKGLQAQKRKKNTSGESSKRAKVEGSSSSAPTQVAPAFEIAAPPTTSSPPTVVLALVPLVDQKRKKAITKKVWSQHNSTVSSDDGADVEHSPFND
ncbi:hypothetical protein COCNU_scaffold000378G000020 [Cocos nucifera]|nr:hypothetical protein [Cocos nucifera]